MASEERRTPMSVYCKSGGCEKNCKKMDYSPHEANMNTGRSFCWEPDSSTRHCCTHHLPNQNQESSWQAVEVHEVDIPANQKDFSRKRNQHCMRRARCCQNIKPINLMKPWPQIIIVCILVLVVGAHDFQYKAEPSKRLLGADLDFMHQDVYTEPLDFDSLDYGDETHFGRKNLNLTAVVGRLFNRSIIEELKKFDSRLLSGEDSVQVHFPTSYIPGSRWLVHHEESNLLQGVPLPLHEGSYNVYVMVRHAGSSSSTTTLPCTINVVAEGNDVELPQSDENSSALHCPPYEPITAATLTIKIDPNDMSPNERVSCVQSLSSFIDVPSGSILFHTTAETHKKDRPFLSGPGNAAIVRTHRGDREVAGVLILSWVLGCGSDINGEIPGLARLENTASDGSLAQALGYDVAEWQIVNRIPSMKKIQRMKRQANGGMNYPKARKLPPGGSRDNIKAIPGLETEETVAGNQRRGKVRVQLGMIRATPMPGMPVPASRIMPLMDRSDYYAPPSTPTIIPPMSSSIPEPSPPQNQAPMTLFGVSNVKARIGAYVKYRIPQDAFYDKEEGSTRNLKLQLMDLKTNKIVENVGVWPLFDSDAQLLYGVPDENAEPEKEYLLVATDSGGKSSTIPFSIIMDVKSKPKPNSHKFTFYFTETEDISNMVPGEIFSSFGRKLSVALAKPQDEFGSVLSMQKTDLVKAGDVRYVTWFDNSFNNAYLCQSDEILKEAHIMIGPEVTEGRNRPAREFVTKFKPEYKLKSIKIELLGPCLPVATSSIISTTTSTAEVGLLTTEEDIEKPPLIPSPPPQLPVKTTLTPSTTKKTPTDPRKTTIPVTPTMKPMVTNMSPTLEKDLPPVVTQVGNVVEFKLPMGTFNDAEDPEAELKMRLVEWGDGIPPWVSLDPNTKTVYIMPTEADFDQLSVYNNETHRMWKGGVVAIDKDGGTSPRAQLEILIGKEKKDSKVNANHMFQIGIKNYEIKNFTANDRLRLIQLLCDIFGDPNADSIYVYPLRAGSVIFSWHNSSLSHMSPCPYEEIAMMADRVFDGKNMIDPKVRARFEKNNFEVKTLNCSKASTCKSAMPVPPPTVNPTTSSLPEVAAAGKSTSVLIIAVIVVCLVILVVILVVKCRLGKSAREKNRKKREQQQREDAAIAAGNVELATSPKIKKGVPIIFQDEIAMEANGNANPSSATPLIGSTTPSPQYRGNGNSTSPAITVDDEHIHEETPFTSPTSHHPMTPPTPIMSDRPPPPYVTPH